ncbi:MAG: hypothetical protein HYU33_06960 [Candidatus Omnitrophica bacterium]|nr:hypothetical protein [Candidatus Omnitrophota bacterium]
MDTLFENLFWVIFVGFALFFGYRILKHKGFKGAMFGARIVNTIGEVSGKSQGPISVLLKVHSLGSDAPHEILVGIEVVAKSFASWQMMPVTLTASETQQLMSLLERAVNERATA